MTGDKFTIGDKFHNGHSMWTIVALDERTVTVSRDDGDLIICCSRDLLREELS